MKIKVYILISDNNFHIGANNEMGVKNFPVETGP